MPELPEVENVVHSLASLVGQTILDVKTSIFKMRILPEENFKQNILHQTITAIKRRSKYILLELSNSWVIVIHLGMSGRLLLSYVESKHNHLVISLSTSKLILNDPRRFGLYTACKQKDICNHNLFKNLGIEPLSDNCNLSYIKSVCKRKVAVKNLIMNANYIVGIGNIYANEILYISKIHPLTLACNLKNKDLENLLNVTKKVLLKAIKLGGSTLKDYVNADGKFGSFQNEFKVYGKEKQMCSNCNCEIQKTNISGRSSFICSNCQIKI